MKKTTLTKLDKTSGFFEKKTTNVSQRETKDTSPEIEKILIEGYRKMTPAEKFQRINELTIAVQQMALARITQQYPNISDREKQLRLASLWIDRETMIKVFNWDPEEEGY